ncbi:hypothetical protein AU210_007168 [Fusarium oxysporum f. sp. radicis-cucumerinum]|uniref:NmrA-like domain-containing protein n=1 Tax=Fusarium oxysporum f. sp. radicis-cucumerinum TaxID=327505 RepID=A0A2H3HM19_FUSOX|nr:hypothetical protein AU210_007168 [Fusarium oxysporum f. sp. radicis-cucumerinum]RKK79967.1 hypothetical protein BFJ71_g16070 [Fusarium oxysporum]
MSKLITIFGATGNQGGSVIKHILEDPQLSNEYKIRGITRDTSKKSAQDLIKQGVEVVSADLNSVESLTNALKGSHTVFLVTNYWETTNGDIEYAQGKNVTDVAKDVGVSYLIFSSLVHVTEETEGRLTHVPHFDSKANIEKYIRASGVPSTFVLPGYYMSNFTQMISKAADGSYQLFYPVDGKKSKFPLFDAAKDTGLFVKGVLKHADTLLGKQVLEATAYYSPEEIVDTFSQVTGKKASFVKVTPEQYRASLPEAIAEEYLENQLFVEDPGYFLGQSLDDSLALLDSKPTTWAEFVQKNAAAWD